MCGRFTLFASPDEIARFFELPTVMTDRVLKQGPRYNIAPTNEIPAIRNSRTGSGREISLLRWGLIPHWAKEVRRGPLLINARAETVAEKPAFRSSFRYRRCLIVADGFFEWKKQGDRKQPHYFQVDDGGLFAFAGIWESWKRADEEAGTVESCAIITTEANELIRIVHDRMPVILPSDAWDIWLDEEGPKTRRDDTLQSLLRPFPAGRMSGVPVDTLVNSPGNDLPDCVGPVGPPLEVADG